MCRKILCLLVLLSCVGVSQAGHRCCGGGFHLFHRHHQACSQGGCQGCQQGGCQQGGCQACQQPQAYQPQGCPCGPNCPCVSSVQNGHLKSGSTEVLPQPVVTSNQPALPPRINFAGKVYLLDPKSQCYFLCPNCK